MKSQLSKTFTIAAWLVFVALVALLFALVRTALSVDKQQHDVDFKTFLIEHRCEWVMSIPPATTSSDPNQYGGRPGPAALSQKTPGRDIYRCADGGTLTHDRGAP